MIRKALDRAKALGLLVLALLPACSSHVDVGFTSEGGAPASADAASSSNQVGASDGGSVMTAACSIIKICNDAGRACQPMITYAAWCTDVCKNSIDVCDGECVDTSSDPKNCGRCGHECASTDKCVASDCRR